MVATLNRSDRTFYRLAVEQAHYYAWSALRGHALPGNSPVTGRPRTAMNQTDRTEGIVAHKALAHHWLRQAREIRLSCNV